ncbi:MAG: hypothetical protein IPQ02_07625 [Saprospiraceae bacterium]|uniref:Uncharacterized protein n=1 Tax=Candidatus Defluviibacterium haderslevense TaxID=2981993 RepID=A0A9D7SDE0_9BACT|nr:hypothetical protein [Candidatus Defluviibacterium haderslevense]MBL0236470.1 hypothetical protein [Candidatus Defluviibacterium haderslevense]
MSKTNKIILATLFVFLFILWGYVRRCYLENKILNNKKFSICKVIECSKGIRAAQTSIDYCFLLNGKEIYSSESIGASNFILCSCIIDKKYNIVFDSLNPSNSKILLKRSDFYKFGLEPPDTLDCVPYY